MFCSVPGRRGRFARCGLTACLLSALLVRPVRADSVLSFQFTPAPRAQIAIWIEDAAGHYLRAVALTEAVAYRGIGNRPGASQMNSGYRWPYGRREGALPIWAHRRMSAKGARSFPRVIFQSRVEGLASRTTDDQSPDHYFCLQFDQSKSSRDDLDAVSCASAFNSDKGRYLTANDVAKAYSEPWEDLMPAPAGGAPVTHGREQALPLGSLYPPRMDVMRCTDAQSCYDSSDVDHYASDARAVMPEIDAVTLATPPGDAPQSVLFSVPNSWAAGDYVAYIEVNLEGDYNARWNATSYPTPMTPSMDWDLFAEMYGYAYRGQPSLVWKLPFSLGPNAADSVSTVDPVGRSSWNFWSDGYGSIEAISRNSSDATFISSDQSGSGFDRLRKDSSGQRFGLKLRTGVATLPPTHMPPAQDAGAPSSGLLDAGVILDAAPPDAAPAPDAVDGAASAEAGMDDATDTPDDGVGPIQDLSLHAHPNRLRAHTWVVMRFRAVQSVLPLHAYEVRVSSEPIVDEASFIAQGRQAKNATDSAEGATLLTIPTDVPAGEFIEATIGDLVALTHYYVGVRATDEFNHHGPISVAEFTTPQRQFATVTPCFVATAAYGSPLAAQVGVLRRLRDRYLMPQSVGRAWVDAYYTVGAQFAGLIAPHPIARAALRGLLSPLIALAHRLE
jgi:hypothetical protein